jgi:gluconolactonase
MTLFPKSTAACCAIVLCLSGATIWAQGRGAPQGPPTETIAPDIPGVVKGGTKVEVVKDGFQGTESPVPLPDGSLLFPETTGNRITRIDLNGNSSTFLELAHRSNAIALDPSGRLISLQDTAGATNVAIIYPKGSEAVLADNFDGKAFGRPNDLVVDGKGGVYFTDSGQNQPPGGPPPTPPQPLAVWYITPARKVVKVAEGIGRPNGIQLSPDEKILYVNDMNGEYLLAYDIQPDGTVRNRRNLAKYEGPTQEMRAADGLAVDAEGRLYVATPVGIQVFSPQGQLLGVIPVSRSAQNLAFAGPDKKTLFILGRGVVFKLPMLAQGFKGRPK